MTQHNLGSPADISVSAPTLDDLLAIVGARGLPYDQQIAALQRGVNEGLISGKGFDVLKEHGLAK